MSRKIRFQLFILDMTLAQYHTYWSISMKKVTQCFFWYLAISKKDTKKLVLLKKFYPFILQIIEQNRSSNP